MAEVFTQMGTFGGKKIEDTHPDYQHSYVAFPPLLSTKDHPEICLSLEHDNRMRLAGWADIRKKAILLSMLRPCTENGGAILALNHFVLEMQQLYVLRNLTGFEHRKDWMPDVTCMRLANSSLSGLGCTETADDINTQIIAAEERREIKRLLLIPQQAQGNHQISESEVSKKSPALKGRARRLPFKAAGVIATADSGTNEDQKDLESSATVAISSIGSPVDLPHIDLRHPTSTKVEMCSSSNVSEKSFVPVSEGTKEAVYWSKEKRHGQHDVTTGQGHERLFKNGCRKGQPQLNHLSASHPHLGPDNLLSDIVVHSLPAMASSPTLSSWTQPILVRQSAVLMQSLKETPSIMNRRTIPQQARFGVSTYSF